MAATVISVPFVPESQVLGPDTRQDLLKSANGDPYILRIRQLRLSLPWLELLRDGRRLPFDVDEMVNKMQGEARFVLRSVDDTCEDSEDPTGMVRCAWRPPLQRGIP